MQNNWSGRMRLISQNERIVVYLQRQTKGTFDTSETKLASSELTNEPAEASAQCDRGALCLYDLEHINSHHFFLNGQVPVHGDCAPLQADHAAHVHA
eukprot:1187234-Pleurochrysis_carterae.AAC.1